MTETNFDKQHDIVFETLERGSGQLAWGGLLLNGGALIAIGGVIGQSHDPDKTLTMLLVSLWLFVVGGALGVAAGLQFQRMGELRHDRYFALRLSQQALRRTETVELQAAMKPEEWRILISGLNGLMGFPPVPATIPDEKLPEVYGLAQGALSERTGNLVKKERDKRRLVTALNISSVTALVVGFGVVTILHLAGVHLAEPIDHASTKPASAPPPTSPSASVSILLPPGALLEIRGPGQPATTTTAIQQASQPDAATTAGHEGR